MEFRVLGPLEVRSSSDKPIDIGGHRQRRLLAALLLAHGAAVSSADLVDAVWPDDERPPGADSALRTYISRLRRALSLAESGRSDQPDHQALIRTAARGYVLDLDGSSLDSDTFATAVELCRRAEAEADEPAAVVGHAQQALGLWRGPPYADVVDAPWVLAESRRLNELRLVAIESRLAALLSLGRTTEVVAALELISAQEPARDRLWQARMLALYRLGRQADALRAFQQYRHNLAEATGLEPSAEIVALDRRIAASDPALLAPPVNGRRLRAYQLIERIATDANSETWRAVQPSLGHSVCIRQFRPDIANQPEFIRRFETDARVVGRLEHAHIVPLLDWWREPGAAYLVSRWMPGGTLADRLRDGRMSLAELAQIAVQIGGALAYAARSGRAHGSIDATHVLADGDDNWLLAGFTLGTPEANVGTIVAPHDRAAFAKLLAHIARSCGSDVPGAARIASRLTDIARSAGEEADMADLGQIVRLVQREANPTIDPLQLATTASRNPYKGLRAFGQADAGEFFGRERLVTQLVARLANERATCRCLSVVGPSGSGKSSLVMAGLLPALRRGDVRGSERWFSTSMTPGSDPFGALRAALASVAATPPSPAPSVSTIVNIGDEDMLVRAGQRSASAEPAEVGSSCLEGELCLVVDQFEELFTACTDDTIRRRFLSMLRRATTDERSKVRMVLVMRADVWDRALRYPELADVIGDGVVAVGALRADELEDAIVRPAEAAGCRLEPGLVARIVAEVGAQHGGLPMLQYALTELYDQRDGDVLTAAAYESIGGVVGALARRSDHLLHDAGPDYETAAKQLLLRLVTVTPDGDEVRRRVDLSELAELADPAGATLGSHGTSVLPLLLEARLLAMDRHPVTREPTVELAHDALLHAWPRLRTWLDEDVESLRIHRHLGETARAWDARGRQPADLYRGSRLEDAVVWLTGHPAEPNELERAFVTASEAARAAELSRERARVRHLTRVLVVTAAALVLALVAGGLAVAQRRRADNNAQLAASRATEAQVEAARANAATRTADVSRLLAESRSVIGADRSLGLLLALEADRLAPERDTEQGLADALLAEPGFLGRLPASDHVGSVFISDDTVIGIEQTTGRVLRWRLADHTLIEPGWTPAGQKGVFGLQQSTVDLAAGRVAFGGATAVTVADLATGAVVGQAISVPASFNGWTPVVLSRDGAVVYVGGGTGSTPAAGQGVVTAFDVATGRPTGMSFVGPSARVRKLALSPDGRRLAAGSYDGTVRVWDTSDGQQVASFAAPALPIGLAWSPDGHRLTWSSTVPSPSSQATTMTSVRDVESGVEVLHLDAVSGPAFAVDSFAPDAHRLAVLDSSGLLSVYPLDGKASGANPVVAAERTFKIPTAGAGVAFGPDDDTLFTAGEEISLWSAGAAVDIGRVVPGVAPSLPAMSPDGRLFGVGDNDQVRVLDAQTLAPAAGPFPRPDLPEQAVLAKPFAFRADGGQLAVGGGRGGVQLYNLPAGGAAVGWADPALKLTAALVYNSDGSRLAVGGAGSAAVFDTRTGQRIGSPVDLGGNFFALTTVGITDKGLLVAAAWVARKAVVVDVETGAERAHLEQQFTSSAVSADGRWLALGTTAGTVQLFDTATLQPVGAAMPVFTSTITNIVFSADGRRLAVLGDHSGRLVDLPSGSVLHSDFPAGSAGGGAFSADGRSLILPSSSGGAVSWSISPDSWRQRACALAGRNLTDAEWKQHLPNGGNRRPTCPEWPTN